MARSVSRRGRMKSDDERRIQINSLFIEHEVEAKDLAGPLFASQIIDCNDRDEIFGGSTRVERTRRMIDILLMRGLEAYDVFLKTLDNAGYDHVANRLRTTEVMMTPKNSSIEFDPTLIRASQSYGDLEPFIREASALSLSSQDPGLISERLRTFEATCLSLTEGAGSRAGLSERLKKIEDLWSILSRRVTRIEQRVDPGVTESGSEVKDQIGQQELEDIKTELAVLKTDAMSQVEELTSANTQKAAVIQDLLGEVEQKTTQLQEAQNRIEELEQRIQILEAEKLRSLQEVDNLREELDSHRERVKHQEDWFNAENLRLKNKLLQQETALKQQEVKVNNLQEEESKMRQTLDEQQEDLKEQRRMMEEQSYQLDLITRHMITISNTNPLGSTKLSGKKNINRGSSVSNTAEVAKARRASDTDAESDGDDGQEEAEVIASSPPKSGVGINIGANNLKTHSAVPSKIKHSKNHFSNTYHRTSFNTAFSASSHSHNAGGSNVNSNSAAGANNSSSGGGNTGANSNTVCLNVPPSLNQPHTYWGSKRPTPSTMLRGYSRKK